MLDLTSFFHLYFRFLVTEVARLITAFMLNLNNVGVSIVGADGGNGAAACGNDGALPVCTDCNIR